MTPKPDVFLTTSGGNEEWTRRIKGVDCPNEASHRKTGRLIRRGPRNREASAYVPKAMRDALWAAYVPGQERRMDPTSEYLDIALSCVNFVERLEVGDA